MPQLGPCGPRVSRRHSLLHCGSLVEFTWAPSLLPLLHGEEHTGGTRPPRPGLEHPSCGPVLQLLPASLPPFSARQAQSTVLL